MASKLLNLILAPEAENDFALLLRITYEKWGEVQVYAYRSIIDEALKTLRKHPLIGRLNIKLSVQHRLFPAGHHIIIYRIKEDTIHVSRILHERMDIIRHI